MKKLNSNTKIVFVIAVAAILLYVSFHPESVLPKQRQTKIEPVLENKIIEQIDCNACKKLRATEISVINPDSSRTYYVWMDAVFQGEYTKNTLFRNGCDQQIIACYSDIANDDWSCHKDNSVRLSFACEPQTIILK